MKNKIGILILFFISFLLATDYPHNNDSSIKDWDVRCKSCHDPHNALGPYLAIVNGNYNMCYSLCHNPTGDAKNFVIDETKKANPGTGGIHHAWDVPGDNSGYDASTSTATYINYYVTTGVDANNLVCSTCHEQHNHRNGKPFLMADAEEMCRDCHAPRSQNTPPYTSHPVGVPIPATKDYSVPANLPLFAGDTIGCMTCHDVHYAYSDTSEYGTASSGTRTSLTDTLKNWAANQFVGWQVKIYPAGSDTGNWYQVRIISSNTSNTISWTDSLFGAGIIGGNRYVIRKTGSGDGYLLNQIINEICTMCHTFNNNNLGLHLTDTTVLWPGGQYGSNYAYVDTLGNVLPPARAADAIPNSPLPSSFRNSCFNCHWPHGWPDDSPTTGVYPKLCVEEISIGDTLNNEEEDLCYTCHDGIPAYDVKSKFQDSTHHPVVDSEQIYQPLDRTRKVECTNCHNPHIITAQRPLVFPDSTDVLIGWMKDPVDTLAPYDSIPDYVTFCLECHSSDFDSLARDPIDWGPYGDVHGDSVATGTSYGDVIAPYSENQILNGFNYVLACTDCHDPHGSPNIFLIKTVVNGQPVSVTQYGYWYELCTACHVLGGPGWHANQTSTDYCAGGCHDGHNSSLF